MQPIREISRAYGSGAKSVFRKTDQGFCHSPKDGPPSHRYYDKNGTLQMEAWHADGRYHREGAPAVIEYHPEGNKHAERWYLRGKPHREDGPAEIVWASNGQIIETAFYLEGQQKSLTEFMELTSPPPALKKVLLLWL